MKTFVRHLTLRKAAIPARTAKLKTVATRRAKVGVILVSLVLLVGPALLSACSSQKNLCPAYNQHIKREALPY